MLLNFILLLIIIITISLLYKYLKKNNIDQHILSECNFFISNPEFEIDNNIKIAKYSINTKNKNIYFIDFPLGFKFYSDHKFRAKIKITYTTAGDDDVEIIYDKIVNFEDNVKEHIYYINDVILGSIDIEIYANIDYGNPVIGFEILQNNICHMTKEHKLEIKFPD